MMTSKLIKVLKGMANDITTADGLLYNDWDVVSPCQKECTALLAATIQLEEESYLIRHPEVPAMLKKFLCEVININKRIHILEQAGRHFTRPYEELDKEIREILKLPAEGPYTQGEHSDCAFKINDLEFELLGIILKHYPLLPFDMPVSEPETPNTISSSFLSDFSSATTVPTPEPTPIPEPTMPEIIYKMIEACVDKATILKITDDHIKYDTAYVELMKAVEEAMEIPVQEIRNDIADLLNAAYTVFEEILYERARIEAAIAWERRMRKKYKRTLRQQMNFKGYETPPPPRSGLPSSHESYRIPPPRPCPCNPQWTYNRYPKDRFGIYIPLVQKFSLTSTTVSPAVSSTRSNAEEDSN